MRFTKITNFANITGTGVADFTGQGLLFGLFNANTGAAVSVSVNNAFNIYLPAGGNIPLHEPLAFTGIRVFTGASPSVNVQYAI